jgi:hypothetical protein
MKQACSRELAPGDSFQDDFVARPKMISSDARRVRPAEWHTAAAPSGDGVTPDQALTGLSG